jgi:CheY-like chemotaxis protein
LKQPSVLPIDFLFVDDDALSNLISKITVEVVLGDVDSQSFTNPQSTLEYLTSLLDHQQHRKILLLDLNMPGMSGWEFLDRFDNLEGFTKKRIHIYILSSSVDERDKVRTYANKNVMGFLVKPLTKETVLQIADGWMLLGEP